MTTENYDPYKYAAPEIDKSGDSYKNEHGRLIYNYLKIGDNIYDHAQFRLGTIKNLLRCSDGVVVSIPVNNGSRWDSTEEIHIRYDSVEGLRISRSNAIGWYKRVK